MRLLRSILHADALSQRRICAIRPQKSFKFFGDKGVHGKSFFPPHSRLRQQARGEGAFAIASLILRLSLVDPGGTDS
jgi:hypothetical protein